MGPEETKPWKGNLMSGRHGLSPTSPISWLGDIRQASEHSELAYMYKMGDKTELPSGSGERARFCLYAIQLDLIKKHN